jgi:ABC-type Na+ efflux pump permease subunit
MVCFSVIDRELRVQARQAATYWLRTAAAAAVVFIAVTRGLLEMHLGDGGTLLASQVHAVFVCLWLLVPVMTADTVSRERREGTLGLLLLTPLRPPGIILAKSLANGLRGLSVVVVALPAMALPVLLGGVGGAQLLLGLAFNLAVLGFALAAGLTASACCVRWGRATALALILAVGGVKVFAITQALGMVSAQFWTQVEPLDWTLKAGLEPFLNEGDVWREMLFPSAWTSLRPYRGAGSALCASLLSLLLAQAFAAWRLRAGDRSQSPSKASRWVQETFCTPVYARSLLERFMRHSLQHNPVGWLERRSWTGRALPGAWFLLTTVVMSVVASSGGYGWWATGAHSVPFGLALLLMASIALSAAASFHRERETGVMELLLVTPLSEGRILLGRLGSLWFQFLPSVAMLLGSWWYLTSAFGREWRVVILLLAPSYLVLPMVGLYFSLRCRWVVVAWAGTLLTGLLLPWLAAMLPGLALALVAGGSTPGGPLSQMDWDMEFPITALRSVTEQGVHFASPSLILVLCQLIVAGRLGLRTLRDLRLRQFVFQKI